MLYVNSGAAPRRAANVEHGAEGGHSGLNNAVWIDLCLPSDGERLATERATGAPVPAEADLAEIESSSRLSVQGDTLTLSTPMTYRGPAGESLIGPLGFILSPRHLVTVRFAQMSFFDTYAERFAVAGTGSSSVGAFLGLVESIVDRLADVLEHVGSDLTAISGRVFQPGATKRHNAAMADRALRSTLRDVGLAGERVSNIRDSLMGVNRILLYVRDVAGPWIPADLVPRFATVRQDVASLTEYDNQITNKVQFLLDATLGFINIEQAQGIKVLTVVSVVGVPPTLIASIYGMNFKWIPELQWEYGYFYGLVLIVLSGVLPLLWFKRQGWI